MESNYREKIYSYDYEIEILQEQLKKIKKEKRELQKNNNNQSIIDWVFEMLGY